MLLKVNNIKINVIYIGINKLFTKKHINIKIKKILNEMYSDKTNKAKFSCEISIEYRPANSPSDSKISKLIFFNSLQKIIPITIKK